MSIKIKVEKELSDEFVGDLLVTAFDGAYGGCWYWATPERFQVDDWLVVEGDRWVKVYIRTDEDSQIGDPEQDKPTWIDAKMIQEGIQGLIDGSVPMTPDLVAMLVQAVVEEDNGQIDSSLADCVIQAALFREIVFG